MTPALLKDTLRTMARTMSRFLSIFAIVALGVGFFAWVAVSAYTGPLGHQLNGDGEWVWWAGVSRHEGLSAKLLYCLIFLCLTCYPPRWRTALTAAGVALIAFCAVVAMQYAGENPMGLFPRGKSIFTNYEFQGTIGNIDMVSGYLSLAVPLLLGGFLLYLVSRIGGALRRSGLDGWGYPETDVSHRRSKQNLPDTEE